MVKEMRLYRSVRYKKLTGLCGGLAETFNIDLTVLRLIVLISGFFTGGATWLIYFLASLVIPKETELDNYSYQSDPSHHWHHGPKHHYNHHHYSQTYEEPKESKPNIDEMMEDIEKKAMWKEIEELRAKLAKFEKEDK